MSKRVYPQRPKTTESYPHPLTNGRNLSKSQIMSKRGCLTTAKTTRPNNPRTPYAHNRTKTGEIANHEQKGVPTAAKNSGITPPSAHERTELVQIANCEQKGVSIEVENDENMHPFAHRRAKSNEIATHEQEAAQTGQPETATLSGKATRMGSLR